jgi:hypothetical protein
VAENQKPKLGLQSERGIPEIAESKSAEIRESKK